MTVGEFIVAWCADDSILANLLEARVEPFETAQESASPRIAYRQVSRPGNTLLNTVDGIAMSAWQVDCWAATETEARYVSDTLKGSRSNPRLNGYKGSSHGLNVRLAKLVDERTSSTEAVAGRGKGSFCVSQDWEIWNDEE